MKRLMYLIPLLLLLSFTTGSNSTISKKERKLAVQTLLDTRDALIAAVSNLSDAQWNYKVSPERWSIKECVQHIALSEAGFWQMIDGMVKQTANPEKRSEIKLSDDQLVHMITDRSKKMQAPDMVKPDKATWTTADDALKAFSAQRDKLIIFMQNTQEDLRNHVSETPFGYLDAYQVVLLDASHSNRHTQQINEVKTAEKYPL
jgi:DinB superfamily